MALTPSFTGKKISFNSMGGGLTLGQAGKLPTSGTMTTSTGTMGYQAPPPIAAPPVQPQDPVSEAKKSNLTRSYNDTSAAIDYDEGRVKREYGFDDASNPFSRARLLQQSFENRQRATTNTLAARGQLYSGALVNQKAIDQRGYDTSYDQLRTGYQDALQSILQRRTQARTALDSGTIEADAEGLSRALELRADPTELSSAGAEAGGLAPGKLSPEAAERRRRRQAAGITDIRRLTPAQKKKLKAKGLL